MLQKLPDEIIVRILYTVFLTNGKVSLILPFVTMNRALYLKFGHLIYIWKPYIIASNVTKYAEKIRVGVVMNTKVCRNISQFINLVSASVRIRTSDDLMLIPHVPSTLKHLGIFISTCHFMRPADIARRTFDLKCKFKLESFAISCATPFIVSKFRKLLGSEQFHIIGPWHQSKVNFGKYISELLNKNSRTLQLIQFELFDALLVFGDGILFSNLKLIVFDTVTALNLRWLRDFHTLNKETSVAIHNTFLQQLLLNDLNWRTWLVLPNPRKSLDTIKKNLSLNFP